MSKVEKLAAKLEDGYGWALQEVVAAELRRLDAENAQLRATLAASCDDERQQLYEAGPGGGCSRALDAERQVDALRAELEAIYSAVPVAWMHESGNATYAGPDAGVAAYNIPLIQKPVRKS